MNCTQNGCRLGKWEVLTASIQCRKCTECARIAVTAEIPMPIPTAYMFPPLPELAPKVPTVPDPETESEFP